jgi:hypothetical protein
MEAFKPYLAVSLKNFEEYTVSSYKIVTFYFKLGLMWKTNVCCCLLAPEKLGR